MADHQNNGLGAQIEQGFAAVNQRLTAIEVRLDEGFSDLHRAVHAIMVDRFSPREVSAIRAEMKNPPNLPVDDIPPDRLKGRAGR